MHDKKEKKSKYIFLVLRLAVVVIGITWAIYWISTDVGWDKLAKIFGQMNFLVLITALTIFTIAQFIVALRWWFLLRSQSIFIDFTAAVRLHFLGLFYNNCMPGSVGGDLVRAWYVTHHTEKKFEAALSVFVDRIVGLVSTLLIAFFFYSVFLEVNEKKSILNKLSAIGFIESVAEHKKILLYLITGVLLILGSAMIFKIGRAILKKACLAFCLHSAKALKKLQAAIIIYCNKPLSILVVFALTVFLQLLTITGFWILGRNIGIEVSIIYYYVFFTLTWVLGAVPISIGGAVVVEGLLVYAFILVGVNKDMALALALSQRIVWMITSLPGAAIHLLGAHLPKDISIDYENGMN